MTGAEIKAWRLKREIRFRDWSRTLARLGIRPDEIVAVEVGMDWPSIEKRRIEHFILGYKAAERRARKCRTL